MKTRRSLFYPPDPNVAGAAALIGHPTRAAVLIALLDGGALPASALASRGAASPQAASAHLRKLVDGGFLTVRVSGRHRLYRLASREVARALEALLAIAAPPRIVALRQHMALQRLREARVCYDHLAGRLGVAVTDALMARGAVRAGDGEFRVPARGERFFAGLGSTSPRCVGGAVRSLGRAWIGRNGGPTSREVSAWPCRSASSRRRGSSGSARTVRSG